VVVVEPAAIVDESEHGLRALYVALTRCTSRLALVHARRLPDVLGLGPAAAAPPAETAETVGTVETAEPAEPEVGIVVDETSEPERAPEPEREPEEVEAVEEAAGDEVEEDDEYEVDEYEGDEYEGDEYEGDEYEGDEYEGDEYEGEPEEVEAAPEPEPEPVHATSGLAETVVVSTPTPDLAVALDAVGDLDHDIARAVAAAVADKLGQVVSPALLPLVAAELVRMLEADRSRVPDRDDSW
jgi:ATP-dependent exoDNAse (exonuclease V) beta subunit